MLQCYGAAVLWCYSAIVLQFYGATVEMFLCQDAVMLCCVSDSMSITYRQTDRATTRGPSGPKNTELKMCNLIWLCVQMFYELILCIPVL